MKLSLNLTSVVILTVLLQITEQMPRCASGNGNCGTSKLGQASSFSSKYRALDYDQAAMKLLMEKLLVQHNAFHNEYPESDEDDEWSTNKNSEYESKNNNPLTTRQEDNFDNKRAKLNVGSDLKRSTSAPKYSAVYTTSESPHWVSPFDSIEYRWKTTSINHPEHIIVKPSIEQVKSSERHRIVVTTKPKSDAILNHNPSIAMATNNVSKRTTTIGPHEVLLRPQQFNSFIEPLMASMGNQGNSKIPPTKPKEKINSSKSTDRGQDIRGGIQLAGLNRPISKRKPIDTLPGGGCKNTTSGTPNNKNPIINTIKVKMGPKTTTTTTTTTTIAKPGIRKSDPNAVASLAPGPVPTPTPEKHDDGNLISALASIVSSDENYDDDDDDDDSDGDDDDDAIIVGDEDEYDGKDEEQYESAEERENFSHKDSEEADDDTSSDVISSVVEEVSALIRGQIA